MAAAGYTTLGLITAADGLANELARVFLPLVVSLGVYSAAYWAFGGRELAMLLGGLGKRSRKDDSQ